MTRDEALALLRGGADGVAEWNRFRLDDGPIPSLNKADLRGAYLRGANLLGVKFIGTDLSEANLVRANLRGAFCSGAKFIRTRMELAHVELCNLSRAELSEADLFQTKFSGVNLDGANLAKAICSHTVFAHVKLSETKGLGEVRHQGPSTVGIDTLILGEGKIPEAFLRGCGLPESWIANIPALIGAMEPIQFYSVFISYSVKDEPIVKRIYADLQARGVRCWYAPEDLKIGDRIRVGIDEAIRVHDKLLLVLSKHSVASDWVEKEVETAMEQERRQKRTVLFPIRLDDVVMAIDSGWPADIRRTRNIGDFRKWKDHDAYAKSFDRLLRDLKAEGHSTTTADADP